MTAQPLQPAAAAQPQPSPSRPATGTILPVPQILHLAERPLTPFQQWTGRNLDDLGHIGRLLLFRRMALESDLRSRWARSDFFWMEAHRQLAALSRDAGVWKRLTESTGVAIEPEALKSGIVEELFIETHLSLYRGARQLAGDKPAAGSREFAYCGHLRDVFDAATTDPHRQAAILVTLADRWIAAESEASHWDAAIAIARDVVSRVPFEREYAARWMALVYHQTMAALTKGGPLKPRDARTLKQGIDALEGLRAKFSWATGVFALIGHLRHFRAIALGNHSQFSEALVESRKGLDYAPGDEEALKTDARLIENMKILQARMQAVLAEVRSAYNKRLSAEGARLSAEASRGFAPMNEYMKSEERKRIQSERTAANTKDVWLRAGYPEPETDWNARAAAMYAALVAVVERKPADTQQVEQTWREATAQDPSLAQLDSRPAIEFLRRRLFGGEAAPDRAAAILDGPAFAFASPQRVRGEEPLPFWLFSRQGIRLKIQMAVALLLIFTALSLASFDALRRSQQNRAYAALMAAAGRNDYARVVDAAEDFLAHRALHADERAPQVKSMYAEALVRWFSLLPGTPDKTALQRARRYQDLIGTVN